MGEDEDGMSAHSHGMGGMPMDFAEMFAQFHHHGGSPFGGGGFTQTYTF